MVSLSSDAQQQLQIWLYEFPHEVVVECVQKRDGIGWGQMLSKAGRGGVCSPYQAAHASWSMHTHPSACYKRNRTVFGWPSGADYVTFLNQQGTEHIVCSIEGMYVLRVAKGGHARWSNLSSQEKKKYQKQWDIASDTPERTPEDVMKELKPKLKNWLTVKFYPYT